MREKNKQFFLKALDNLKNDHLINGYSLSEQERFVYFKVEGSKSQKVVIKTNLEDSYWTTFDDYYEEFTDYLLDNDSFESHVDWAIKFIRAYLAGEYTEVTYVDKKTDKVAYRRLTFFDKNLGRRELSGPMPAVFVWKKLLRKYDRRIEDRRS